MTPPLGCRLRRPFQCWRSKQGSKFAFLHLTTQNKHTAFTSCDTTHTMHTQLISHRTTDKHTLHNTVKGHNKRTAITTPHDKDTTTPHHTVGAPLHMSNPSE